MMNTSSLKQHRTVPSNVKSMSISSTGKEQHLEEVRPRQGGITVTFPTKLYNMLFEMQNTKRGSDHGDLIRWVTDGSAFVITNPKIFTATLLPRFFRTNKFSSFQRQLNAYGFTRENLYAGQEDVHIYHHDVFHRDYPQLIDSIRRRGAAASGSHTCLILSPSSSSTVPVMKKQRVVLDYREASQARRPSRSRDLSLSVASIPEVASSGPNLNVGLLSHLSTGVSYSPDDASSDGSFRSEAHQSRSDGSARSEAHQSCHALDEAAAAVLPCTMINDMASLYNDLGDDASIYLSNWNADQECLVLSDED